MAPELPEETQPRCPEFEGSACELTRDDETVPGQIEAVYRPAPDAAPDVKRVVVRLEGGDEVDIAHSSDDFGVLLR